MVAAGDIIRAADIPTGLWAAYTPAWTASGTAPAIGNGSITGRYCRIGDLVFALGRMVYGSTTTFGTGSYRVSLPVTSANVFGSNGTIGSVWLRDSSVGDYTMQCIDAGTYFECRPAGAAGSNTIWSQTVPAAAANTDWLSWHVTYEAA